VRQTNTHTCTKHAPIFVHADAVSVGTAEHLRVTHTHLHNKAQILAVLFRAHGCEHLQHTVYSVQSCTPMHSPHEVVVLCQVVEHPHVCRLHGFLLCRGALGGRAVRRLRKKRREGFAAGQVLMEGTEQGPQGSSFGGVTAFESAEQ
jgi:hypothetical protein